MSLKVEFLLKPWVLGSKQQLPLLYSNQISPKPTWGGTETSNVSSKNKQTKRKEKKSK
jgi:hypothetical protein